MGLCWALEVPCIPSAHASWDEAGRVAGSTRMRALPAQRGTVSPVATGRRGKPLTETVAVFLPCGCTKKTPQAGNNTNLFSYSAGGQHFAISLTGRVKELRGGGALLEVPGEHPFPPLFCFGGPPHSLVHGPLPITPTSSCHCHLPTSSSDLLPVFPPTKTLTIIWASDSLPISSY